MSALYTKEFYENLNAKGGFGSDVRQTVISGPRDANGRADFLEAGAGLQVISKDVFVINPLILTIGNGFKQFGKNDVNRIIESSFEINDLPASETSFLYAEVVGNEIVFGHTLLAPEYSLIKPSVPATGQYWYPTDHRSSGEVYNGTSWVAAKRIFLGECETDSTDVTGVISYAFNGVYVGDDEGVHTSGTKGITRLHKIGVSQISPDIEFTCNESNGNAQAGDIVLLSRAWFDSDSVPNNSGIVFSRRNEMVYRQISNGPRHGTSLDTAVYLSGGRWNLRFIAIRAF